MEQSQKAVQETRPKGMEDTNERIRIIKDQLAQIPQDETFTILEAALNAKTTSQIGELYDRTTSRLRGVLGMIVFATAFAGTSAFIKDPKEEMHESEQTFEYVQKMKKDLMDITGVDILQIAQEIGRSVVYMKADSPTAKTIIHVGQSHNILQKEKVYKVKDEITMSQSQIANFLSNPAFKGSVVFSEGLVEESGSFVSALSDLKPYLATLSLEQAKSWYITSVNSYRSPQEIATANSVMLEKLKEGGYSEVSPMVFEKDGDIFILTATGYLPDDKSYTVNAVTDILIEGAGTMLNATGVIKLVPAETSSASIASAPILKEIEKKVSIINTFFQGNKAESLKFRLEGKSKIIETIMQDPYSLLSLSAYGISKITQDKGCKNSPECKQAVSAITDTLIPEFRKAVDETRENTAVELIAKYAKEHPGTKVFPLIYGTAHDFTDVVIKWNATHLEQFNLVTVKSY